MKKHKWTERDDKIAFYAYLSSYNDAQIKRIMDKYDLKMTYSSFKMRIGNFRHLKEGIGLSHYSKQTKKIFEKYKNTPKDKFGLKI